MGIGDSRASWRDARTFRELCALGERFVRGEIRAFPGWNAPDLDTESDEIAECLARACRAGFLTCASQPARPDQRAFVAGFADEAAAQRLTRMSKALDVRLFGARWSAVGVAEPVSRAAGRFHAFAGHDARIEELACFADEVGPEALEALRASVYVSAFDPEWGRRELLWTELMRVLESA
jgi:hypothetical protein